MLMYLSIQKKMKVREGEWEEGMEEGTGGRREGKLREGGIDRNGRRDGTEGGRGGRGREGGEEEEGRVEGKVGRSDR